MTELEKKLADLLRQAMKDMELLGHRLHCNAPDEVNPEDCLECPIKTDCECDDVLHWVHAAEAEALIRRAERTPAELTLISDGRRPCFVDGKKAAFHRWCDRSDVFAPSMMKGGHPGGTVRRVTALVEFEDGTCAEVYPEQIVFEGGFPLPPIE